MTLRAKMALALAGLAGLAALLVGLTTYVVTAQRVRAEVDRSLRSEAEPFSGQAREVLEVCGVDLPFGGREGPGPYRGLDRFSQVAAQCLDDDGAVVHSSAVTLPVDGEDVALAGADGEGGESRIRTVTTDGVTYRMQTIAVGDNALDVGAVQIARDFTESQRVLNALRLLIGAVIVVVTGLGALIGWLVARKATRSLVQLTDAAEEVASSGRLDVAVPSAGNDEPGRLARAFATMLAALGQSRDQQQQLVQDAGHELRTPLTSLRTNVETLRRYDNLPEPTRQAILSDLELETRELGSLVDELVQLATDTYDDEPEQSVALEQLVERAAERVRRRTGRTVTVQATPSTVIGRPRDLARAVGNLLDNAAKFSDAPAPVEVAVDHGTVRVRDHGPGVPDADRDQIFQRFYRSPAARSKPGSGLGLAIVEQTALAHGGTLAVANHPDGGAVFTLSLPEAPPPPPPAV